MLSASGVCLCSWGLVDLLQSRLVLRDMLYTVCPAVFVFLPGVFY